MIALVTAARVLAVQRTMWNSWTAIQADSPLELGLSALKALATRPSAHLHRRPFAEDSMLRWMEAFALRLATGGRDCVRCWALKIIAESCGDCEDSIWV